MRNPLNHEATKSRRDSGPQDALRVFVASWFICVFCSIASAQDFPAHPRLLLDRNDIDQLKLKIAGPFAAQWKEFRAGVDRDLTKAVELPPRGGNWSHNYVCPEHGARLKQGKQIGPWEWEHICPVGPHTLHGDPSNATTDFDGNGIMGAHLDFADELVGLGVVYQVSGEKKYADKGREILLAYADKYESYPVHDNQGRPGGAGGHVASQSLTEATWLIQMAQGADLIWDTLSDDERKSVADKLFRPALNEVIIPHIYGIHNIQCRENSAIGLVGFLLDDPALIHRAIDDSKTGFRQQIAQGVHDDGMWVEGSTGYHFFTIDGLIPLAEAARHCGIDLYSQRFKSMFDGPMNLAMPDMRLPNFNDSGIVNLHERADSYDLAYARWHDASYLPLIEGKERTGRLAMLYGMPELPKSAPSTAKPASSGDQSRNLVESGYAILQQTAGDDTSWLCVKYGPHGGGHGHFDKNHFILWSHGQIIMPDAGTHAYGSPLHNSWDKTSLAHNTLTVDEQSQAPAQGKCVAFGKSAGIDYAITDAGDAFKDLHLRFIRSVAMVDPNLIVVVDQIRADEEHTLDLAAHLSGKWNSASPGGPAEERTSTHPWKAPDKSGYRVLEALTSRTAASGITLRTQTRNDLSACLTLAGDTPTEVITGTGVGETTEDRIPIAILRRRAKSTAYVWAISLGAPATLTVQPVSDPTGGLIDPSEALVVRVHLARDDRDLVINPTGLSLAKPWTTHDPISTRLPP
jgi:hypothetical protein